MLKTINQAPNTHSSFGAFRIKAQAAENNRTVDEVQTMLYHIKKDQKEDEHGELWYGLIKRNGRPCPEAGFAVKINLKSTGRLTETQRITANLAAERELGDYIKANYKGIEIEPDIDKQMKKNNIKNEWHRIRGIMMCVSKQLEGKNRF